ncbi:carboxymuconolactone decarboxylase family protein [Zhongshania aquimaris]|uniref:Carboxymuconolactone decarboxylase family protein n=1 Tax=Zhongshania aquimaris TaxID=2857107 RepID=A0ABS6VNM2_9GAMM|nr:carboxymuconolactone decarboxylase family protein [Zhongshania aquimaris]MBW2939918.1 carboxymuconolactone decarboxylase family protein [Zhongshania aquimaris]
MPDDKTKKIKDTAAALFSGYADEKPYELWLSFDKNLAKEMSRFVVGDMYARDVLAKTTRQLVAIAALSATGKQDELKLHIHAALNIGCTPQEISESIFQIGVYAGFPAMNNALLTLRGVLEENGLWPLEQKED